MKLVTRDLKIYIISFNNLQVNQHLYGVTSDKLSVYPYSFTVHVFIIQTLIDQHMHYALKLHTKTQSLH
jgi:hypothetical protein